MKGPNRLESSKVYGGRRCDGIPPFDNPAFTGEAVKKWKEHLDPSTGEAVTFTRTRLTRAEGPGPAYRVGVSCGSCHIATIRAFRPRIRPSLSTRISRRPLATNISRKVRPLPQMCARRILP